MFPFADKIALSGNRLDVYFDVTKDIDHFDKYEMIKVFERMKFSQKDIQVSFRSDYENKLISNEIYGKIELIFFDKDIIRISIDLTDAPMGDILRNNVASGAITMFFLMVTHDNYRNIQYVNLMPINATIVPKPTMDHFEGEIT